MKCMCCDRQFKDLLSLSIHLIHKIKRKDSFHKLTMKKYYDKYLKKDDEGICKTCGKETTYLTLGQGYRIYCKGGICSSVDKQVRDKTKNTCLSKYGVDNPMRSEEVKAIIKEQNNLKFGSDWGLSCQSIIDKRINTVKLNFYNRLLNSDRLKSLCEPLFDITEYKGIDYLYSWKCTKCNSIFEDNIDDGHIPRCLICFPIILSKGEHKIVELCEQYFDRVERNKRYILDNKYEIDIYIPEIKLGIEFNGLYWHGECKGKKDKNYHLNKTLLAKEKGIQLIHIFEDEWIEKQEIVKSILLAKMGKLTNRIFARKCEIKEINNNNIARDFLDNHHIQGYVRGIHIGLYYNNVLVSMASFGKNRYSNGGYELLRFCNHCYLTVVGGMSKLIKYFIRHNYINKLITYADLRFGIGHSYNTCGFVKTHISPPGYFYTDSFSRESRIKYQKHKLSNKLKIFDSNLTEWENMQLNGYDRIWDCGNNVYELKLA